MLNVFITATNTNVGKTYLTLRLIRHFSQMGYKTAAFKPIETGVVNVPHDAQLLYKCMLQYNNFDLELEDIVPNRFALPAAPIVAGEVDFAKIDKAYNKLKSQCDILLIEGAGGIKVPISDDFCMFDFIEYFNAKSILVVQSKLGCINDLELNLAYFTPDVWCVNLFDDSFYEISYPYLQKKYKNIFVIQQDLDKIAKNILE
ncbi:MAG: dethiobiotin synthase [Epsilonproteobacteria bacterium]|nr:dethiobiotin synthase [Campylobacterota bacterium]